MKFTCITLMYGLLVGLFGSPSETPQLRPHAAKQLADIPAAVACVDEPLSTPPPINEEISTKSSSDLKPVPPPERPVTIIEPPRRWILSDKTWRSIVESTVNIDVSLERGDEYIGVRIVLPFGS